LERPESTFRNIKRFVTFLPVDYYVLLQSNYQTRARFEPSNYLYFENLPLLTPAKTAHAEAKMSHVTYEDLTRCNDLEEVKALMNPRIATDELFAQIGK
jgi:hypothetical protein